MNISNFEQYVNPIIVSRGLEYFKEQRVEDIEAIGDHLYAATVAGSDLYSVEVQLKQDGSILNAECDCPYTDGPYCKHMVAVFYALRTNRKPLTGAEAIPAKVSSAVTASSPDALDELLSKQPKEKLLKLLISLAVERPEIADRVRAEFAEGDGEKEKWLKLMRRFIENAMNHHSSIDYRHCSQALEGAYQVINRVETAIDEQDYLLAVDLLLGVMAQMVDMFQFTDDSSGSVSMVIDDVNSAFQKIVDEIEDNKTMAKCFQKVLHEASATRYDDWSEMRLDLLGICTDLTTTRPERDQLEQVLDTASHSSHFDKESVILLRHEMIRKLDGDQAAAKYLYENRRFSRCREILLGEAMRTKQYAMAEELALEGEQQDAELPGLVRQWKERRFTIYELCGQTDKLRIVGRELAVQGGFAYYQKLKALYNPQEWQQIYPAIHQELSLHSGYYSSAYTDALIEEREYAILLAYVQKDPQRVLNFYRQLLPLYQEQVYELLRKLIVSDAANANNRSHYQKVCSHLRLLNKIGGKNIAAGLIEQLLRQYPRKPAFREELLMVRSK